jgi:hypothetical protein
MFLSLLITIVHSTVPSPGCMIYHRMAWMAGITPAAKAADLPVMACRDKGAARPDSGASDWLEGENDRSGPKVASRLQGKGRQGGRAAGVDPSGRPD